MTRIVIAAGGTAGHVVPALAVADELRASGAEVSFVGTRERAEADLVPTAGYEIDFLSVTGFDRSRPLSALGAGARMAAAVPAARKLLKARGADAVLGGGGYIAAPVGLAAVSLRTPLVLTEADSHLGLANRLLAPYAKCICTSFQIKGRTTERYRVTGRPVPQSISEANRDQARMRLGVSDDASCILVFGGSLGARSINEAAFDAFVDRPLDAVTIIHIAGKRDYATLADRLSTAGNPPGYRLFEYLPDLADPLAACDLVVARSGGSVFELAAAGRPAILVPYPHATADHQLENARWMADASAATIVRDDELTGERLRELCDELLGDPDRLASMSAAARSLGRPRAARDVADALLEQVAK